MESNFNLRPFKTSNAIILIVNSHACMHVQYISTVEIGTFLCEIDSVHVSAKHAQLIGVHVHAVADNYNTINYCMLQYNYV